MNHRTQRVPSETNKNRIAIATDEIVSSMSGFQHILYKMKDLDPLLNMAALTH